MEQVTNLDIALVTYEESITQSTEREATTLKTTKTEEEQSETSNSHDKNLKKPNKTLPCPRCNSMDTKFCYYNNYNVNQPRHFCNNCQRYWTGGGTMKNIHVGASHKKNKRLASHWCKGEPTRVGDLVKENGVAIEEAEDEDDQAEKKEGGEKELGFLREPR